MRSKLQTNKRVEKMSGIMEGKIAIVTGGARGMGAATVREMINEGAEMVYACDVLEAEGKTLADELGPKVEFRKLDVSQDAEWAALVAEIMAAHGRIDALVNNAGVLAFGILEEVAPEEFDRVYGVNVKGPLLSLRNVGKVMREAGKGAIVNISSLDGLRGVNMVGLYSSSKWALRCLTKSAAMEFGPHGVRVNSVHPGGVDTAMGNPSGDVGEERDAPYGRVPLQRIGEPGEIAAASVFLCSDKASYITGAELAVDGGWSVGYYHAGRPGAPAKLKA